MLIVNEQQIINTYLMKDAIQDVTEVLKGKEAKKIASPHRTVIEFPHYEASALYMPSADLVGEVAAVKVVTIFPHNPANGKATTQGVILLSDASNGEHLAMLSASYLTRLRTGALSGIATNYLAKQDAKVLAVIGTGAMAFEQVLGVLAVRPIERILLVNRNLEKAKAFGEKLKAFGVQTAYELIENVAAAVRQADIINCATRANEPVFDGADLKAGAHVNGVGSYLPHMHEVDLTTITRAAKIVVDDLAGVKEEAGELIDAEERGKWSFEQVYGEIGQLVVGVINGRENKEEITFFKSVGAAYFDLAVAKGVYAKAKEQQIGTEIDV
ncbi:ornithine cyclodeaminase family protein [Psychrobacillus lasiicapitis]|uniref:Ornithine cyclodeaminase family protein n=1 Tax=Psychrobacillus lasiicapitis TaxID=1636719 RepID=A0A544SYJ4_9BACI|nr:ornithine cyclodeaminase family protein [Psychrobacillus lasiicapitis]TQR10241.1 ornithine cyclodeaminase family protein [Psychrobacillus lasiicapitis]GGA46606.1 ornithine cyclodeaminase [Psychrobacillus lasiicapitis]